MVSVVAVATHAKVSPATVSRVLAGRVPVASRDPGARAGGDRAARLPAQRGGAQPPGRARPLGGAGDRRHRAGHLCHARQARAGRARSAGARPGAVQSRPSPGPAAPFPRARALARPARHPAVLAACHGHGRAGPGHECRRQERHRDPVGEPGSQRLRLPVHHPRRRGWCREGHDASAGPASHAGRLRRPHRHLGDRTRRASKAIARRSKRAGRRSIRRWSGTSRRAIAVDAGYQAMSEALAKGLRFRAVVAASDELALGCMAAAADRGFAIPDDMAIIGFGGLAWVGFTRPAMTTVALDVDAIARAVGDFFKSAGKRHAARQAPGDSRRPRLAPIRLRRSSSC